jgi:hypothetical protein
MLILTHIGQVLPGYLNDFFLQFRKFNGEYDVMVLTNQINCSHEIFSKYGIKTYPIENLVSDRMNHFIRLFGHGSYESIHKNIIYGGSDYWCVTAIRLFFIYEYVLKNNISNFFHFENDIMIYEDLKNILNIIKTNSLYTNQIAMTRGTSNKIMSGFMFISDVESLNHLLSEIIFYLETKLDLFSFGIDHINEMALIHIYQIKNPNRLINLPILPNNNLTKDFELYQSVFDPATYGQFLDGTPGSPGISIIPDSIIGSEFGNSTIPILFEVVDGLKIPFVIYNDAKFKINSLHIHSKRLHLFLS